jgi:hypothetical protein
MLTINDATTSGDITAIHALPAGTIIKVEGDFEGNLTRLTAAPPPNRTYKHILPGIDLYALYGSQHVIAVQV